MPLGRQCNDAHENRKLSVSLTGNEINKAYSDMNIYCWTREFVLFCDTFEFGAAISRLSRGGRHLWWSFLKQITVSESWLCSRQTSENVRMNVINRSPPFCAFQIRVFLENSVENQAPCLVVTFWADPCALEFTTLRDWEMLPITLVISYNYTLFDYI